MWLKQKKKIIQSELYYLIQDTTPDSIKKNKHSIQFMSAASNRLKMEKSL